LSPVHLRADPGDYAESVLLPGDPERARYIAESFFEEPRLVNEERGMLGYTGTYRGTPISVQTTGMGCPSTAIVVEELAMLGAKNLLRVGTCGGYHPEMAHGDLVVATAAVPHDGTVSKLTGGYPYAPAANFDLVRATRDAADTAGRRVFTGPVETSDLFYDTVESPHELWHSLGVLAVEMEAAVVFTLAAIRGLRAGCLLTVSDVIGQEKVRIPDEAMRSTVDNMTELALDTLTDLK
jgi:DeoD family purine-nucleoside phosphorylase